MMSWWKMLNTSNCSSLFWQTAPNMSHTSVLLLLKIKALILVQSQIQCNECCDSKSNNNYLPPAWTAVHCSLNCLHHPLLSSITLIAIYFVSEIKCRWSWCIQMCTFTIIIFIAIVNYILFLDTIFQVTLKVNIL